MDTPAHSARDRRRNDARMLDTAEGILVGLRRCSIEDAFAEIVHAAKRHHLAALTIARALVTCAENPGDPAPGTEDHPTRVARHEWGDLLDRHRPHSSCDHPAPLTPHHGKDTF